MEKDEKLKFLADSLVKAKQVMEKVEDKTFKPTQNAQHINQVNQIQEQKPINVQPSQPNMRNMQKSKMPKEILESFRDNPIVDPTAPFGMESLVEEASKQIPAMKHNNYEHGLNDNSNMFPIQPQMDTKLLEYIIKKTVEETLEQVNKKTALDEDIQIRIGDKLFGGKINTLKEIKKQS